METNLYPVQSLSIAIMSEPGDVDQPPSGGVHPGRKLNVPPPVVKPKEGIGNGFLALVGTKILSGNWSVLPTCASDMPNTRLVLLSISKDTHGVRNGFAIWLQEIKEGLVPIPNATATVSKYSSEYENCGWATFS